MIIIIITEGTELPNQEKNRMLGEKESYKHLGILEVERKEKSKKEYLWRTRKLLETKLYRRNLIKGVNPWTVYLGTILEVDKGRTSTNGPENKKIYSNA